MPALTPFILYQSAANGEIDWPAFDTTDGRPAVVFFTSEEKALRFRDEYGMGPSWRAGGMDLPEFVRWLRHNLAGGRPLVIQDPAPTMGTAVEIPIFLANLEQASEPPARSLPPPAGPSGGDTPGNQWWISR